jgi:hypothetical protein
MARTELAASTPDSLLSFVAILCKASLILSLLPRTKVLLDVLPSSLKKASILISVLRKPHLPPSFKSMGYNPNGAFTNF